MKNLITELESKVKDCNNTNSIFNTNKYVLLKDAKELLNQAINFTHCYTELCDHKWVYNDNCSRKQYCSKCDMVQSRA